MASLENKVKLKIEFSLTVKYPCQLVKSFSFPVYLQMPSGITHSSHTHQPHFSSSPYTNLNSTHIPTPSSDCPAKPRLAQIMPPPLPRSRRPIVQIVPPHRLPLFSLFFLNSSSPFCSTSPIWSPPSSSTLISLFSDLSLFPSISHFLLLLP